MTSLTNCPNRHLALTVVVELMHKVFIIARLPRITWKIIKIIVKYAKGGPKQTS